MKLLEHQWPNANCVSLLRKSAARSDHLDLKLKCMLSILLIAGIFIAIKNGTGSNKHTSSTGSFVSIHSITLCLNSSGQ